MFIGEFQLGLQRDFPLKCVPATAFFRAAFEYQYWDAENNAGSATAIPAQGVVGGSTVDSTATASNIRMDLTGIAVSTGFYW